jgi:hypothetical protein
MEIPRIGSQMDFGAAETATRAEREFMPALPSVRCQRSIGNQMMLMKLISPAQYKTAWEMIRNEFYTR